MTEWIQIQKTIVLPSIPRFEVAGKAAMPIAEVPAGTPLAALMAKARLTPDELATARTLIQVEPKDKQGDLFAALQYKVAYHSQRDNAATSEGAGQDNMCNLTTLAMCLEYLGYKNPGELDGVAYPQFEDYLEALRVKKEYAARTTSGALESLAKDVGASGFTSVAGAGNLAKEDWLNLNARWIRGGYAMLLSIGGHIVRWQGVTDAGLVIDDPYGVITLRASNDASEEAWSYGKGQRNEGGVADTKGEDNVWTWEAAVAHAMKWMVAIK